MFHKWSWIPALIACLTVPGSFARNLFVTSSDPAQSAFAYTVDPFASAGPLQTTNGLTRVISAGAPNKFYAIGQNAAEGLVVLEGVFPNLQITKRINLGQAAADVAVSPDGRRLLVLAGGLQILDTANESELAAAGTLNVGTNPTSVAVSLDSTRAYVLGSGRVTVISLTTNTLLGDVATPGPATGVAVSPAGFVYATTTNAIYEIDGRAVGLRATISLNGLPGKLEFSPDGKYAIATNAQPVTGASAFHIDLATRVITRIAYSGFTLDRVVVTDNTTAYATSTATGGLYQIKLDTPGTANPVNLQGVTVASARDLASSGEYPGANYLFISTASGLIRYDLRSNTAVGPTPGSTGGRIWVANAPVTGGVPVSTILINDRQTVDPGTTTQPLIVRVLDAAGLPLAGLPITFAASDSTVMLSGSSTTTNNEGYAQTHVTVPSTLTSGTIPVVATVNGTLTAQLAVIVGSGSTPGTPGGSGALRIIQGQGQVLGENYGTNTQEPLIVQVRDAAGAPLPNADVKFEVTSSSSSGGGTVTPSTVKTDGAGRATVNFFASSITQFVPFVTNTIKATSGNDSVTFYITTVKNQSNGQPGFLQTSLIAPVDSIINGKAGETIAAGFKVRVFTSAGAFVPNVGARFVENGDPTLLPSVSCRGDIALSDDQGNINCDLVIGPRIGSRNVTANVGSIRSFPMNLRVTQGDPSGVRIVNEPSNNQTGNVGATLPRAFLVQVTDAGGNPLPGVDVTFEIVTPGSVVFTNVVSRTNQDGQASVTAVLGTTPGTFQVRARAGAGLATFNFTVLSNASRIVKVAGSDNQTAAQGQPFARPIAVQVLDANGQPVANAPITFAPTGSITLSSPTATTNAQGEASTTVTAGTVVGPATVRVSLGTLNETFNLTVRLPGPGFTSTSFLNAAGFQPGIAPGSLAYINVTGVAPDLRGSATPPTYVGPLPSTLAGVEVLFNGVPAPMYAVSNVENRESIIVQVPFETQPGTASVTIRSAAGGSTTVEGVQILAMKPGIFEFRDVNGRNYAVGVRADGSYISSANPARRGEIIRVFATGLGQTTPTAATNRAGLENQNVAAPVIVGVNNEGVRVVSAQLQPGTVGIYIVALEVPLETAQRIDSPFAIAVVPSGGGDLIFGNSSLIPVQ
jgi:uncharacterized protein (TIGR03437 family)